MAADLWKPQRLDPAKVKAYMIQQPTNPKTGCSHAYHTNNHMQLYAWGMYTEDSSLSQPSTQCAMLITLQYHNVQLYHQWMSMSKWNCHLSPILSSTSSSNLKIRDIAKILQNKETKLDAWTLWAMVSCFGCPAGVVQVLHNGLGLS